MIYVPFVFMLLAFGSARGFAQATTTTTLALTNGSEAVTSASAGSTITLTATVMSGLTPVTPGLVEFCDAAASHCTDIHLYGSAQLTSSGTATIKLRPGTGSYSYRAVFVGTNTYESSSSAASALTIGSQGSPYPSLSTMSSGQANGATFPLNTTVAGILNTPGLAAPTGTVSFIDTAHGNNVVGTANLSAASSDSGWGGIPLPGTLNSPLSSAVGDFNGDGRPDLVFANSNGTISIALSNGDNSFASPVTVATLFLACQVVTGDFNSDGKTDIAVASSDSGAPLEILLGNGDGTFTQTTDSYATEYDAYAMSAADFNRDGVLDLAIVDYEAGYVTILLGNGDGTFTTAATTVVALMIPAIAIGDFNGDGIPDFAVPINGNGSVAVLLGNGDGTFRPGSISPTTDQFPLSIAAADFNGDGNLDLFVGDPDAPATILLGDGKGGFTSTTASTPFPGSIAVADFNRDGKADVAVSSPSSIGILLGNGDGTFQPFVPVSDISSPLVVAGDFGYGTPGLVATNVLNNTVSVIAQQLGQSASGQTTAVFLPGTYQIVASYPGDSNYSASVSGPTLIKGVPSPTKLTLTGGLANTTYGQPVTLTATLSPYTLQGKSTDGEVITFYNYKTGVSIGTGKLASGTATLTTSSLPVGDIVISADYPGDSSFRSTGALVTITVKQAPTTLSLTSSSTTSNSGSPVTLTASLSPASAGGQPPNGEPITFYNNGVSIGMGTLAAGTATLTTSTLAPGLADLTASYVGDTYFASATSNSVPLTVLLAGQTTTNLGLTVTSSGALVTSVASGSVVALTASLLSGTTPVTRGTVIFCDNLSNNPCSGPNLLGSVQLTASGTAVLRTRLGIGKHSLQASFSGTKINGPSTSVLIPLTVTGTVPTTTLLSKYPGPGIVAVAVRGNSSPQESSTVLQGTVQLEDTTFHLDLGTSSFGTSNTAPELTNISAAPATGTHPFSVAAGDLNNDGIPDLAVANSGDNTVSVLLGRGDGTYQPQVTYATGSGPYAVAIGDFSGDGNLDLAITNLSGNTVSILMGNGDGTFQKQKFYATGGGPNAVAVGDLNGDGILDLAVANQGDETVSVLLGNGNGTFQTEKPYTAGGGPTSVAVGDFNGDEALDLAVANNTDNTVSILLGNGDGTFQSQKTYATGKNPISIAAADFNSDGKLDLAVANLSANTVSVLMGNGDGTLQSQTTYAVGSGPYSLAASDLNVDGRTDLIVANSGGDSITLMLNGVNGFNVQSPYTVGNNPISIAVSDLNGDSVPDLALLNGGNDTVSVVFYSIVHSAYLPNIPTKLGPGTRTVVATYTGNTLFAPSSSSPLTINSPQIKAALTLSSSVNPSNYGAAVTLMATLTPYSDSGVSADGGPITFLNGNTTLGTGTLSAGVTKLTLSSLPQGTNSLKARFGGDIGFASTTSNTLSLAVRPAALTAIASNAVRAYAAPNPAFTGTVSGAVNADTFTVTGTTTATPSSKVGTYPIVPSVSGTEISNYTVTKVNGTLTVTKATPVVTWAAPAAIVAGVPLSSTQLNATASAPGTFTYDPASGTVLPEGTSTLSAKFTPTDMTDYESVTTTVQLVIGAVPDYTISVKPSSLTIAAGSTGSASFTITPSGGFNEAVNFSCSGLPANSTCKFSPATVTPNGAPVTSTITIQTNVESAKLIAPRSNVWLALVSGSSTVSLCGIFVLWLIPRKKRAGRQIFGVAILIVAGMNIGLLVAGCGGGGSSPSTGGSSPSGGGQNSVTPAGTSTVVVKALSGTSGTSDSHTANLTVVITN